MGTCDHDWEMAEECEDCGTCYRCKRCGFRATQGTLVKDIIEERKRVVELETEVERVKDTLNIAVQKYQSEEARVAELEAVIVEFCRRSDWAAESWKSEPHIAALFAVRDALGEREEG